MGLFEKAFNKFAESNNKFNRGINKVIGKDVLGEIRPIEAPREFAEYNTFPQYGKEEPESWQQKQGKEKTFSLSGATVTVSKELDACIEYRKDFSEAAKYYAERFKYKYSVCVNDFDTLTHYFEEMYLEGLQPMLYRAYSLLLPFGVFDVDNNSFNEVHALSFNLAVQSYRAMCGIEEAINQEAQDIGDAVGGAIQLEGGGFGFAGAMKGVAQAEAFNLGMGLLGKYLSSQMKMSPEQKAAAFGAFNADAFFEEVYSDYYNTFLTLVNVLTQKGVINGVKVVQDGSLQTMIDNLQNPMFPKDRIPGALATMISTYPFEKECFAMAEQLCQNSSECAALKEYFIG